MPHRRVDADETYLLGINRQASPVERLQSKYREFQKRMMIATPLEATPLPEQSQPTAATVMRRKVLGESISTSRSSTRSAHSTSTASSIPQGDVFGTTSGPSLLRPKPNARMQIFVDPDGTSGEEAQAAGEAAATPWNELGTRKERIKENVPKVSKPNGTTLRQPGRQQRVASAPVASTSRIPVFRDPTPGGGGMMPPPLAPPGTKAGSKGREMVPETPACSSIVPFKDEVKETPATPRFVPFKDDLVSVCTLRRGELRSQGVSQPSTPSASSGTGAQVPDSVMKVKTVGMRGQLASSEAEALRKDPFKNYPDKPVETE